MKASIISIGNSKGIRIPKFMLLESGLGRDVELYVNPGEVRITPAKKIKRNNVNPLSLASQAAFAKDWLRPEEEEAWASYQ